MGKLGVFGGVGQAMTDIGRMGVANAFQSERDAAAEDRQSRIAEYSQNLSDQSWVKRNDITSKQGAAAASATADAQKARDQQQHEYKLDEIEATAAAKATTGGTNSNKKYQEMLDLGVPEKAARGVAYGTYKTVTDPATGATVLLDVGDNGKEVGRMAPVDPGKPLGAQQWQPADQQPSISYDDARAQSKQEAKEKAGWFSTDSSDFGEEGRKGFIERRAKERMAESVARNNSQTPGANNNNLSHTQNSGNGIVDSAMKPQTQGIPQAAIEMLRKNPGLAAQFEQKYGVSASGYLQ